MKKLPSAFWQAPLRSSARIALSLLRLRLGRRWPGLLTPLVGFGDTHLRADLTTPGGLGWYRYGTDEQDVRLLDELIGAGDVMIDGGANAGVYAIAAASLVGKSGRVYAFEPAPPTRSALERNIKTAGCNNVVVLSDALGANSGSGRFVVMPKGGGLSSFAPENPSEGVEVLVEIGRLDDLIPRACWPRVRLIKLDVEGAEALALRGAHGIINVSHPALLLEVEDSHLRRQGSSAAQLRQLVSQMGYATKPGASHPNELYIHSGHLMVS